MKPTILAAALLTAIAFNAMAASAPPAADAPPNLVAPQATPSRWQAAFDHFAVEDALHPQPPGGVLFVGSSSIRLWNDLEDQFANLPVVIKRGFGGSQLSDCVRNLSRLVLRYQPKTVLVYAGDNDLAAGTAPQEVLRRFVAFVDGVRAALPETRIAYISIKPSPARSGLLPEIRETNALIHGYAEGAPNVDYIDVYTPMLGADGLPRRELFRDDALHLNADGYALWKRVIAPHLDARQASR